ncbi:hypothetical protein P152DRAFT_40264 [Eremomyces bilateralis CBS 781.70]|uniref:Uncharacterized protein n=1 Tax=Eremomyces bilateralis CBS 781.70 TaxID=1392243 RepID=A0A6G1G1K0_9PEZI|nr:uncharacterized protein P152DRAFT_40264 [Eremomyces bilateralis CBS 781.70]KAF1811985.1 hypothetical protein P152DRAFT_40264 [Eremomyces bilateralis CBS 781.70]
MSDSSCSTISNNGLLNQPFGYPESDSYYACGFPSNYTQAAQCCGTDPVAFSDPCYSSCGLPASMNDDFDLDRIDYFDYMKSCLNSTGEVIDYLWCHATPHAIQLPPSTTKPPKSTSTFDQAQHCATADPQQAISVPDPKPACGMLPNMPNSDAFGHCCQPAPVQWSVFKCYEYCGLPRGSGFGGKGNLTEDEILGSFKTCMLQRGNGSEAVFDGLYCRANREALDLRATNFTTTTYLTGTGNTVRKMSASCYLLLLGTMVMTTLGIF